MVVEEKETLEGTNVPEETPTQSPEIQSLQAELETLRGQAQRLPELEKGFKSLQQAIAERDKELKRRESLDSQIASIQDTIEVLATAVASKGEVEEIDSTKRQDILADLKKRRAEQEAKAKQKELTETQQEYAQKADVLYARAKVIFGDDDDSIERVEDLLTNGRYERAEARVTKAESKKSSQKENKIETEEQRIDRIAQEKFQKLLEEKGLLETYSSSPSGVSSSVMEATRQYAEHEITAAEARKRGVKLE